MRGALSLCALRCKTVGDIDDVDAICVNVGVVVGIIIALIVVSRVSDSADTAEQSIGVDTCFGAQRSFE